MEQEIYYSVIMATYNSEDTIRKSLESIRKQTFPQEKVEILIIDGGSTDRTREIALEYSAIILDNPVRLPEPAKMIGLKNAKGKYICIMDSDEELPTLDTFEKRYQVLEKYNDVKAMAMGLFTPKHSNPCCYYINEVGDPFSCFVYKTFKNSMQGIIMRKGKYDSALKCYIAEFETDDIKPIGDSGTVMNRKFIMEHYSDKLDSLTTATIFDLILTDTGKVAYVENDNHFHYVDASFKVFLKKLKFRIVNNIFDVEGSGYASKAQSNKKLSKRKYLFPLYTVSIVFPLIDSVRMAINYKHWVFLGHIIFCWYVLIEIGCQYTLKLFGVKKKNTTYAK